MSFNSLDDDRQPMPNVQGKLENPEATCKTEEDEHRLRETWMQDPALLAPALWSLHVTDPLWASALPPGRSASLAKLWKFGM